MNLLEVIKSLLNAKATTTVSGEPLTPKWHYHAAPQAKRNYRALKREIGPRQARRLTRRSYALSLIP